MADGRPTPAPDLRHALASKLFPELATLAVLLGLWLGALPPWLGVPVDDTVSWLVAVEAATLLFVAILLGHALLLGQDFEPEPVSTHYGLPLLCLFYLIAAFDVWRVHRPAFAARPASLWPFFDDERRSVRQS